MEANVRSAVLQGSAIVAFVVGWISASPASADPPAWFDNATQSGVAPNIPDFYQHQYLPGNAGGVAGWEVGGGWCRPTAMVDGLYQLKVGGYNNLLPDPITNNNTWQQAACTSIAALRNVQGQGVNQFLTSAGYGQNRGVGPGKGLVFSQYYVNQTSGAVTYVSASGRRQAIPGTAFDLYSKALLQGQDVMVRIADTQNYGANRIPLHWWAGPNIYGGNYHYLTGAGIDIPNDTMFLADPDSNKGNTDNNAGWNGKGTDANVAARRFAAADPLPIAANAGQRPQYYASLQFDPANGFKVAAQGDHYAGATISMIETISPMRAARRARTRLLASAGRTPDVQNQIDLMSGITDPVDKIELFPVSTVDPAAADSLSDPTSTWHETTIAPNGTDALGDVQPNGGFEFDLTTGAGLTPGQDDVATVQTLADFSAFDVLLHDATTNAWLVQPIGGPEDDFGDQQVPEPSALMLAACALGLLMRRSRYAAQFDGRAAT